MGHFKGKVVGWDVVNEAISDAKDEYLRDTPARRAIGDDYIVKAFEFAHAADPDAELYYNDYGNEHPEKLEKTIRLIRELKAAGVRLDAVGMQCHFRLDDADAPDRLDRAIAAYAAEGVKVMLTELDVDVLPRRSRGADVAAREQGGANPYRGGLPPEVAEAQARFYGRIFRVVLKHPGVVTRVTFWGTHDGDVLAELLSGGMPHQSPAALGPGPQAQARLRGRPGRPGHALNRARHPTVTGRSNESCSTVVPHPGTEEIHTGDPLMIGAWFAGLLPLLLAAAPRQSDSSKPVDSIPAPSNIRGAEYPRIHPDLRVTFRIKAPDAQKVVFGFFDSQRYPAKKGEDGFWTATTEPQVPGFHYYRVFIDGAEVNDPASETFYGTGKQTSGIEIPEKGVDFYLPKDVPHGEVRERWYHSKTTQQWRRIFVYTPPGYDTDRDARYPVLYLQHGGGEDERGWPNQGRVGFILDNLIAERKARPMLVVMEQGYARRPGDTAPFPGPPRPAAPGSQPPRARISAGCSARSRT